MLNNNYKEIIRLSHQRCEKLGIQQEQIYSKKIVSDNALQKILNENRDMIMTAIPYIEQIFKFTKGSDFFVLLTDNEGCILNALGDENILSEAFSLKMIPGAYMSEEHIGTNAMSCVVKTNSPIQLSGPDHYINTYKRWTCSAAPVKDSDGNLIGVVDLTGYTENVHPHTLGIVVSVAKAIEEMLKVKQTNKENKSKKNAIINSHQYKYKFEDIIGEDENFIDVIEFAKKISNSDSTVLLMGESGTGKELFAQSIYNLSPRCNEPFIVLNCGAIPQQLMESELFGYVEGAFTGAKKGGNPGKFELANGGTIHLDEIGEMPSNMQVKLLRVLEEGYVTRLGSHKIIPVDVRIIASTNKDLGREVEKGKFRKDLYYRLNVLPLFIPPLRERKGDIKLLFNHFIDEISKRTKKPKISILKENLLLLENHDWPGNVREMRNFAELIINTGVFPKAYFKRIEPTKKEVKEESLDMESVEKEHLIKVIRRCNGNISQSAEILGIRRNTLYNKIKKYNIDIS
ncbi:MAG: sigma 54-interacting transcriptional regulator [Tissierellia bacterium]|nr:sigma 54-interacting transcriptional regulator [Tissierellia bacterium]